MKAEKTLTVEMRDEDSVDMAELDPRKAELVCTVLARVEHPASRPKVGGEWKGE